MKIFISHIHEEAGLATEVKHVLERSISTARAFVSSRDLGAGYQWLQRVDEELRSSDIVLVLCSPHSIQRPWVNFEAGRGWQPERRVIPVCHSGMEHDKLPYPLSIFEAVQLYKATDLKLLVAEIGGEVSAADATEHWPAMKEILDSLDYSPLAKIPLPAPPDPARGILLDHAHGQTKWNTTGQSSVFELPSIGAADMLPDVEGSREWTFQAVTDPDQFRVADMKSWRGLILGTPWERALSQKTIEQIVKWVWAGGRLALLGYELGDLHHKANLNELARQFGLYFHTDVVAPDGWKPENGKPYGQLVKLVSSGSYEDPLMTGVDILEWYNLQSLSFVPGGRSVVGVGQNLVGKLRSESVIYPDRQLRLLTDRFDFMAGSADACVAAFAPHGLTTAGAVVGIGTWQLLQPNGRKVSVGNQRFMMNLMRWLGGS